MKKTKFQKRVARVQTFCREEHPDPVTHRQVAYKFSVGFTLAADLCKTAADTHKDYTYDKQGLHFLGSPDEEDIQAYFDEKEASEEDLQKPENLISTNEALQVRNILEAKIVKQEDKAKIKIPKRPISEWTPDEYEDRTDNGEEY